MSANLNKAMFTKLINGSLVQVQLGEPKSLENKAFFIALNSTTLENGVVNRNSRW